MGHENHRIYISNYYKQLFGPPVDNAVYLDELVKEDIPHLRTDENEILSATFAENGVFEAISQMKPNKASGPDGFPAEFYKRWSHIVKDDLMPMFQDFFNGHLQLFHLNFGTITLLPKKDKRFELSNSGKYAF